MQAYRIQNVFCFAKIEGNKLKTSEAIQASINVGSQGFEGNYMDRLSFLIVCVLLHFS